MQDWLHELSLLVLSIGISVALLLALESGEELRAELRTKANEELLKLQAAMTLIISAVLIFITAVLVWVRMCGRADQPLADDTSEES